MILIIFNTKNKFKIFKTRQIILKKKFRIKIKIKYKLVILEVLVIKNKEIKPVYKLKLTKK